MDMPRTKRLDLLGKDYFTLEEAAHYCCVSPRTFERWRDAHGIVGRRFMGNRLIYRRIDLQHVIEDKWQPAEHSLSRPPLPASKGGSSASRKPQRIAGSQSNLPTKRSLRSPDDFLAFIKPKPRH